MDSRIEVIHYVGFLRSIKIGHRETVENESEPRNTGYQTVKGFAQALLFTGYDELTSSSRPISAIDAKILGCTAILIFNIREKSIPFRMDIFQR
jgi:hypothetical protein